MTKIKYRVEVNHGSKYFEHGIDAFSYFNLMRMKRKTAEIWLMHYEITPRLFKVSQQLLDFTAFQKDVGVAKVFCRHYSNRLSKMGVDI